MGTLAYSTTLSITSCGACHIPFAIPSNLYVRVRSDGSSFYCPNGHKIHYYETEEQRLNRQIAALESKQASLRAQIDQQRAAVRHQEARAAGFKGQVTKIKKRVGKGVCPCCNRSFADLARHMESRHPSYADSETKE